jgi:hypothetical protein
MVSFLQHVENLMLSCVEFDNPNTFLSLLLPSIRLRSLDWKYLSFENPISGPNLRSLPFDWDALTPESTALGMPHNCEDLLNLMMGYWGNKIPQLTPQFLDRSPALRVVKREAVSSSSQIHES